MKRLDLYTVVVMFIVWDTAMLAVLAYRILFNHTQEYKELATQGALLLTWLILLKIISNHQKNVSG